MGELHKLAFPSVAIQKEKEKRPDQDEKPRSKKPKPKGDKVKSTIDRSI